MTPATSDSEKKKRIPATSDSEKKKTNSLTPRPISGVWVYTDFSKSNSFEQKYYFSVGVGVLRFLN